MLRLFYIITISKSADLPSDITAHSLRHNFATKLYYGGVDVKTAQYLLGHSTVNITLDIYTHLDKRKLGSSISILDEYLSQPKISQRESTQ